MKINDSKFVPNLVVTTLKHYSELDVPVGYIRTS